MRFIVIKMILIIYCAYINVYNTLKIPHYLRKFASGKRLVMKFTKINCIQMPEDLIKKKFSIELEKKKFFKEEFESLKNASSEASWSVRFENFLTDFKSVNIEFIRNSGISYQ